MGRQVAEQEQGQVQLDVPAIVARLDRTDVLLLRQFYLTRRPVPDDTEPYVLRVLVDKLQRCDGLGGRRLCYSAIRYRLENLVELGLLGTIPRTNPKVYYPLDHLAPQVRRVIFCFAAEIVGLANGGGRA